MVERPCLDHGCVGNAGGYHTAKHEGRYTSKHRVVYVKHHGLTLADIEGKVVRHKCDNSRCIEPAHLELGTQTDNLNDRKDRHVYRKLSKEDAADIKLMLASGATGRACAKRFGVSDGMIGHIKNGRQWV